jgi:ArsR family transcriptional regulator, arsenate/arsenite/antimonite-responsive transcriptional repressor
MYQENLERLSAQAERFKALSHPTRIFIIEKLHVREYCVNELTKMIGVEMPTVSKHLSVLKNVGIIASRKESNNVFYRLKCMCVIDTLKCVDDMQK